MLETKKFTTFVITCHVVSCEWWRWGSTNFSLPLTARYMTSYDKSCELFYVLNIKIRVLLILYVIDWILYLLGFWDDLADYLPLIVANHLSPTPIVLERWQICIISSQMIHYFLLCFFVWIWKWYRRLVSGPCSSSYDVDDLLSNRQSCAPSKSQVEVWIQNVSLTNWPNLGFFFFFSCELASWGGFFFFQLRLGWVQIGKIFNSSNSTQSRLLIV